MVINVGAPYNGGVIPDIILLTLCDQPWVTHSILYRVYVPTASEVKGTSTQGRKSGDPAHPVEASPLPDHQQVTTSPPIPEQEEGEVTPSDAGIPDSIARALLDALQEKRTGNQLPATMVSLARLRVSQIQRCLVTGREPTEAIIQATLDIISVGQGPAGSTTLADKVSTQDDTEHPGESVDQYALRISSLFTTILAESARTAPLNKSTQIFA